MRHHLDADSCAKLPGAVAMQAATFARSGDEWMEKDRQDVLCKVAEPESFGSSCVVERIHRDLHRILGGGSLASCRIA